jgi:Ca2+-binding RTX toxin-like protein
VEVESDMGVIVVDDLDLIQDIADGLVVVTLASENQLADGFQPVFDAVTIEIDGFGDPVLGIEESHTILGGSEDDTLTGGDGDDYIDGRVGSETIDAGAGNDTIVYDSADSVMDGGDGTDTLIVTDTLDLSNVATIVAISNIEVIELLDNAKVVGGINPADVISMTTTTIDGNNTLIIESDGTPTGDTSVSIDIGSFDTSIVDGGYNVYSYTDVDTGDVTTLMVDVLIPIDMV